MPQSFPTKMARLEGGAPGGHIDPMKLDSAYFNKIRIDKDAGAEPRPRVATRGCEMPGCAEAATHRAPKGRAQEGEYFWFCLEHVRQYNKSYNYFSGMNDAAIQAFQRDATIGHRPTWQMGVNAKAEEAVRAPRPRPQGFNWSGGAKDPFRFFGEGFQGRGPEPERRKVHNMEAKSLSTLGLDRGASPGEIKARYKLLVKRHHPDANGGDRSLEDRLREIIQAYSYLKSVGFC
jgi:curved DNA-binding protein CbpA